MNIIVHVPIAAITIAQIRHEVARVASEWHHVSEWLTVRKLYTLPNLFFCFKTTRITTQSTIITVGTCNVLHLFSVLSVGNNVHRNIAHAFPLLCSSSCYVFVTHLQPRLRKYDRHANLLRTRFSKLIRTPAPAF